MANLIVVDDDRSIRELVKKAFEQDGNDVRVASSASEACQQLTEAGTDVALVDIMLGDVSGLDLHHRLREIDNHLPIIFITGTDDSSVAIEAMKLGAFDYVTKPLDLKQLRGAVERAVHTRQMTSVPVRVPKASDTPPGDLLVGRSSAMLDVYKAVGQVAPEDVTVLIRGESGTGKELVARAIYQHSQRVDKPFLAVNCAAIPENLLESELFGHEKGSFTGASSRRIGKFEQCDGGTIFLDEVGDMATVLQGKVLRLLQEQRFERVGGNETIETNVRIIAATNRDLEAMGDSGEFRTDLFFRLNGFSINLPPLRQRGGDLLLLIEHFFARFQKSLVKKVEGISPDALNAMTAYDWPGNIRELQSVLRQAMLQTTSRLVTVDSLPDHIASHVTGPGATEECQDSDGLTPFITRQMAGDCDDLYATTLEHMERVLLTHVLDVTEGNQSQASRILGITRGSLRNKIRALGIRIDTQATVSADDHA